MGEKVVSYFKLKLKYKSCIKSSVSSVVAQMTQFFDTGCIFGVELASQKFRKFKKNLGFFFKNELLQIVTLVGKS